MRPDLRHIDTIILDMDGSLYSYETSNAAGVSVAALCDEAMLHTASSRFPEVEKEMILALAKASYFKHGDCYTAFTKAAQSWTSHAHLTAEEIRDRLLSPYHATLFAQLDQTLPEVFTQAAQAAPGLAALKECTTHAVLTHSCRDSFALPFLRRAGLASHIRDENVWGMREMEFNNKGHSPKAIEAMIEKLGADPARTAFLEDSLQNLWVAATRFPAMTTAYIHHSRPLERLAEGVKLQTRHPACFLRVLARQKGIDLAVAPTGTLAA